ncbi:MAG TPA: twin-arginine translocation signal domain-containing protein [Burkholderiales bacterium]|jgi:nitrous oxide reductase|nr:twin-arginine translocation signal domain-containing protein [Burkholderiales bacterium]
MNQRATRLSRRNFLLAATAGGAATAAAIVATKSPTAKPASPSNDKRATRGYQASAHVDNYYRTLKV